MKKLFYFLGASSAIVAPIVAVVSCGSKHSDSLAGKSSANEEEQYLQTSKSKDTRTPQQIFTYHGAAGANGHIAFESPQSRMVRYAAELWDLYQVRPLSSVLLDSGRDLSFDNDLAIGQSDYISKTMTVDDAQKIKDGFTSTAVQTLTQTGSHYFVVSVEYQAYAFEIIGAGQTDFSRIAELVSKYISTKIEFEDSQSIVVDPNANSGATTQTVDTSAKDVAAQKFWYPFPYGVQTDYGSFASDVQSLGQSSRVIRVDLGVTTLDQAARTAAKATFFSQTPAFLAPVSVVVNTHKEPDKATGQEVDVTTKTSEPFYVVFTVAGKQVILQIGKSQEEIDAIKADPQSYPHGYDWIQEYSDDIVDYVFESAKLLP